MIKIISHSLVMEVNHKYKSTFDTLYYIIHNQGLAGISLTILNDGNFIACSGDNSWYRTWTYAKNDGLYEIDEDGNNETLIYKFTFEEINTINNLIDKFNNDNSKYNKKNMLDYLLYLRLHHTIFKTPTKSAMSRPAHIRLDN